MARVEVITGAERRRRWTEHQKRAIIAASLASGAIVSCPCCGGKLVKLGEDVIETLEVVPRQWKVIQTVREKFSCRSCEKITPPPWVFSPRARPVGHPQAAPMAQAQKPR